jgi:pimeloyl-ACP methyl ester carboxylesterase
VKRQANALAAILVATGIVTGCGGSNKRREGLPRATTATAAAKATSAPRPLQECRSAGTEWSSLPTSGSAGPYAARAGRGRFGIVFVNDSNNDACTWSRAAHALATRGYVVAVFDGPSARYQVDQALSVAAALRGEGVRRIAAVGASVGARSALQLGAEHPRTAVGIVALSAERRINNGGDLLAVGRRVHLPVLSVGSRRDPLTAFGKDTRTWDHTIPQVRTLMLPGADHGVDFLHDGHRRRVQAAILRFLRSL